MTGNSGDRGVAIVNLGSVNAVAPAVVVTPSVEGSFPRTRSRRRRTVSTSSNRSAGSAPRAMSSTPSLSSCQRRRAGWPARSGNIDGGVMAGRNWRDR